MAIRSELTGPRVRVRPAEAADVPALVALLAEPSVAAWWGANDADDVRALLGGALVVEVAGTLGGVVLVHEEEDPEYRHAALDVSIATAHQGQGIGQEALRLVIDALVDAGHHRFTIDPAAANERAIRAYARVGFRPVGVLREYERDPAGGWRDGLLMDLLAGERPWTAEPGIPGPPTTPDR